VCHLTVQHSQQAAKAEQGGRQHVHNVDRHPDSSESRPT
jgi:hypothetical protein